jgi:lysyl-tRNA synthetase class 2
LSDPVEQKERFTEQARQKIAGVEDTYAIDNDFIEAMEYGMPPTGGIGFGIDRMIMLLTDTTSIKEVILFPQMK